MKKLCGNCSGDHKIEDCPVITVNKIEYINNQEMIKRLMELGYVLSKFGKDKTYSQTEMMDVFEAIIEGEEELTEEELKAVKEAEADYKAGRVYTHEEVGKKLGLDEGKK